MTGQDFFEPCLMFSMSDSRSIGPGSLALAGALCCVLGQNTLLSQCQFSLHRRKQGYQQTVRETS